MHNIECYYLVIITFRNFPIVAGEAFVVVPEHDSVILVLAGGVAVVPVLYRRQDREVVLGSIVVADIGFQQDIGRGLVGPLDGGGVPLSPGDLIGIGGVGQGRAGHHGQPQGRRRNSRPSLSPPPPGLPGGGIIHSYSQ